MKFKISTLVPNTTNILFFLTVVSGFGCIVFTNVYCVMLYIGFGMIFVMNELNRLKFKTLEILFIFLILLTMFMVGLRSIMGFTIALSIFPNFIIGASLAYAIVRGSIKEKTALLIFYLVAGYFIYHMIIGSNPNEILPSSQNAISAYVLSSLMLLMFLYRQERIKVPLFPAFLYVILSIWAIGRAGIISSLIIFMAMLFMPERSRIIKIVTVSVMAILVIISVFIYRNYLMNLLNILLPHVISAGAADNIRELLIRSYLQEITPFGFFFGVELKNIAIMSLVENNPHNSYIWLHASLGIVAFILFALVLLHFFRELIGGNVVYGISVFAYLFRIATDSVIGYTVFTFVFFTLTLYGINSMLKKPDKIGHRLRIKSVQRHAIGAVLRS